MTEQNARSQATARRILLTILGEFVLPSEQPVWNATLVEAMMAAGQTEKSARQAVLRAAQTGWLAKSRHGKNVSWSLTPMVLELMAEGAQRVYPMNHLARPWDGQWIILHVSLPDRYRQVRERLYKALQWAGFGNPSPGLWVCPHTDRQDEVGRVIRGLDLSEVVFTFVGSSLSVGATDQRMVQLSWDLEQVSRHYKKLLREIGEHEYDHDKVLAHYLHLLTEWEKLPLIDPRLPNALLPAEWDGQHLAAQLGDLVNKWREPARRRWKEIADKLPQPGAR